MTGAVVVFVNLADLIGGALLLLILLVIGALKLMDRWDRRRS